MENADPQSKSQLSMPDTVLVLEISDFSKTAGLAKNVRFSPPQEIIEVDDVRLETVQEIG